MSKTPHFVGLMPYTYSLRHLILLLFFQVICHVWDDWMSRVAFHTPTTDVDPGDADTLKLKDPKDL